MKTAEEIIISKRFFELTPSEKEVVKEYASNEEDYDAMRWFLISAGDSFAKEKITPSADLRKGVMAHLQQKQAAPKTVWLNGVSAFLFPAEKPFYRAPAFQMAAVAALLVSAVMLYNNTPMQADLAVNDKRLEPTVQPNQQPNEIVTDETNMPAQDGNDGLKVSENQRAQASSPDATIDPVTYSWNADQNEAGLIDQEKAFDGNLSQDMYYREMAVAEEVKWNAELQQPELQNLKAQDSSVVFTDYSTMDGASNVASMERVGIGVDKDKENLSVSQKQKMDDSKISRSASDDKDRYDGRKDNAGYVAPAMGGTFVTDETAKTTTATTKEETEKKQQNSVPIGGTFDNLEKDTVVYKATGDVLEQETENAGKYSITETKAFQKLFFTVK